LWAVVETAIVTGAGTVSRASSPQRLTAGQPS